MRVIWTRHDVERAVFSVQWKNELRCGMYTEPPLILLAPEMNLFISVDVRILAHQIEDGHGRRRHGWCQINTLLRIRFLRFFIVIRPFPGCVDG